MLGPLRNQSESLIGLDTWIRKRDLSKTPRKAIHTPPEPPPWPSSPGDHAIGWGSSQGKPLNLTTHSFARIWCSLLQILLVKPWACDCT